MGVLRRVRENVVKSGHVVGLGSSLVLNPSRESKPIGYVDNSGRLKSKACRFTHGAGPVELEAFFEAPMHPAVLTRAEKVDLPARIDVHEYVRAHFGPGSERHTENTASLSLDFREKGRFCKLLKFVYPLPCTHPYEMLRVNILQNRL